MATNLQVLNAENEFKIAIIGMGPRGLSILEHFVHNCMKEAPKRKIRILCIDSHEVGSGRIWRTDQADHFMMNTLTGQVTMYTHGPDGGPARAGNGPSLYEWLRDESVKDSSLPSVAPDDYAPRVTYGHYLRSVYQSILNHLPGNVVVESILGWVVGLCKNDDGAHTLTLAGDGGTRQVHKVILTTGHPQPEPKGARKQFVRFAQQHPGLMFVEGNSAACMPLDEIPNGGVTGIIGQGLGFFDTLLSLTVGRGGHFEADNGKLIYIGSGREPKIVAGSRSGVPITARAKNFKKPGQAFKSLFMTEKALQQLRIKMRRERDTEKLDFNRDVYPLLHAEMEHMYLKIHTRHKGGVEKEEEFSAEYQQRFLEGTTKDTAFLVKYGLADVDQFDLYKLARPFASMEFMDNATYQAQLRKVILNDIEEAKKGNVDGPLKAAYDVLRDVRDIIRHAVDFAGLEPRSHRDHFLGAFVPAATAVSAGPPMKRLEQVIALMEAGVLEIAGPEALFTCEKKEGKFRISSPRVRGISWLADTLIDSRVPTTHIQDDSSELMQAMLASQFIDEHVNSDGMDRCFTGGGLAVTEAPFHVIDGNGEPNMDCYALGILTEHTRWFQQVGSGTPNTSSRFSRDAGAISDDIFKSVQGLQA
jgi:FAD-NAD(P)-binding